MPNELLREANSAELSELIAYQALLRDESKEAAQTADVERDLMKVFGDPNSR